MLNQSKHTSLHANKCHFYSHSSLYYKISWWLTWEDIEARLLVLGRVSVGGVAHYHARFPDGSVTDQHAADDSGLQLVLPGQPASGRHSGLVVKVIHVRWHVEPRIKGRERSLSSCAIALRVDTERASWGESLSPPGCSSCSDWWATCEGREALKGGVGAQTGCDLHGHSHPERRETDRGEVFAMLKVCYPFLKNQLSKVFISTFQICCFKINMSDMIIQCKCVFIYSF